MGLTTEWLVHRNHGSASDRMAWLMPGSAGNQWASFRQQQYETQKAVLRNDGMRTSQADLQAHIAVLTNAGLAPSRDERYYDFNDAHRASRLFKRIATDNSTYLVSLYFADDGAHVVAVSTVNGETTLFDPNYGEFKAASSNVDKLFLDLTNSYKYPHGKHVSSVFTLRMEGGAAQST